MNRKRIVTLLTLVALLMPYVLSVSAGEMPDTAREYLDLVRGRKYVDPESRVEIGEEEQPMADDPPQYSDPSTDSTAAGQPVEFSLRWTDDVGLDGYVFSFDNGTGTFVDDPFVEFTEGASGGPWWNSDWSYRREITIDNTASPEALTDYAVLVTVDTASLISAGKMNEHGGDIRFIDSDEELDFWVESGMNTANTRLWVKVPEVPASSTKQIAMYYGNPNRTVPQGDGNKTFPMFDNFGGRGWEEFKYSGNPVMGPGSTAGGSGTFASVMRESETLWRMYASYDSDSSDIGLSTSSDGITWTHQSVVLRKGATGEWDSGNIWCPAAWKEDGTYYMLYVATGPVGMQMGLATSPDGDNWTKYAGNPIFNDPDWASGNTEAPCFSALKEGDTYYVMYNTLGGHRQSSIASSTNLTDWTRVYDYPRFPGGPSTSSWNYNTFCGNVFKYEDMFYLALPGQDSSRNYAKYGLYASHSPAFPEDDTEFKGIVMVGNPTGWEDEDMDTPWAVQFDGKMHLYYAACGSCWSQTGVAIIDDIPLVLTQAYPPGNYIDVTRDATDSQRIMPPAGWEKSVAGYLEVNSQNFEVTLEPAVTGRAIVQYDGNTTESLELYQDIASTDKGAISAWMRTSNTNTGDYDLYAYGDSQSTLALVVGLGSNGFFHYWNGSFVDTAVTYSADTWYLVQAEFDAATDKYSLAVYDTSFAELLRVDEIDFGAAISAGIDRINLRTSGTFNGNAHVDDVFVRKSAPIEPDLAVGLESTQVFTDSWSRVTKVVTSTLGATIRWRFSANDTSDNWTTSDIYSFVTEVEDTPPTVTLNSPEDDHWTETSSIDFSATCSDEYDIAQVSLYGDWSGSWALIDTVSGPGLNGTEVVFSETVPDGSWTWNVECYDDTGNSDWGTSRTINVDSEPDPWWHCSYDYRRRLIVHENSGHDLTDYPVYGVLDTAALITAAKMHPDCDDIRVTYDGIEIPSQVMDCNTGNTKIWLQADLSTFETKHGFYLYYGNPSATAPDYSAQSSIVWDSATSRMDTGKITGTFDPNGGAISQIKSNANDQDLMINDDQRVLGYLFSENPSVYEIFRVDESDDSVALTVDGPIVKVVTASSGESPQWIQENVFYNDQDFIDFKAYRPAAASTEKFLTGANLISPDGVFSTAETNELLRVDNSPTDISVVFDEVWRFDSTNNRGYVGLVDPDSTNELAFIWDESYTADFTWKPRLNAPRAGTYSLFIGGDGTTGTYGTIDADTFDYRFVLRYSPSPSNDNTQPIYDYYITDPPTVDFGPEETPVADTTPPTVTIASPTNTTYEVDTIPLIFSVSEAVQWCGYSLNGGAIVDIEDCGDTVLTSLSDGPYVLTVHADDCASNRGSSTVNFTVEVVPFAWWDTSWYYRVPITVDTGDYSRTNEPIEHVKNFTQEWVELGITGLTFDINSIRVVEYSAAGDLIGEVPSQFDPAPDYDATANAVGTIVWIMYGTTDAHTTRHYYVYFDSTDNPKPAPNYVTGLDWNSGAHTLSNTYIDATIGTVLDAGKYRTGINTLEYNNVEYTDSSIVGGAGIYYLASETAGADTYQALSDGPVKKTIKITPAANGEASFTLYNQSEFIKAEGTVTGSGFGFTVFPYAHALKTSVLSNQLHYYDAGGIVDESVGTQGWLSHAPDEGWVCLDGLGDDKDLCLVTDDTTLASSNDFWRFSSDSRQLIFPVWNPNPAFPIEPVSWIVMGDTYQDGRDFWNKLSSPVTETQGSPEVILDFGDAPDPRFTTPGMYPTLLANNGARHVIVSGFFLGAGVDAEPDGQPDATATGDDVLDGNDDEDGVAFTSLLVQGGMVNVDVTASAAGVLNAWMDFNSDGDWADAGEQIFTDASLVTGVNNLTFPVPPGAIAGQTFSRFRFNSVTGLSYEGPADDGEVEDYLVEIEEPTGTIIVEKQTDPDGAPDTFTFTGDVAGTIVDGGTIVSPSLPAGTYQSTEIVPPGWNLTAIVCSDDNSIGDVPAQTATFQLEAGETVTCTFTNTEVPPEELDWGDAPDLPYCTLAASNGASHVVVPGAPFLGLADPTDDPDIEPDGQPDPGAMGDDNAGTNPDDEDGVSIPVLQPGQQAAITFEVNIGSAFVDGWIDFNGSGVWGDMGGQEYIIFGNYVPGVYTTDGVSAPLVNVPPDAVPGQTFARFRINTIASLPPCGGPADDGEVEDYLVEIEEPVGTIIVEKQTDPAGGTGFDFAGDLGSFTLDDGGSQVFAGQAVGDYNVTETVSAGWVLTNVVCTGGTSTPITDGVTIHLGAGENITCTFENTIEQCTTDCYVDDASGDDSNGGTSWTNAKKTIQAGINQVDAGGNVHVAAGTYAEYLHITKDGLTVQGAGIDQSIIDLDGLTPYWHYSPSGSYASRGGVLISSHGNVNAPGGDPGLIEDVTFEGFTVKNAGIGTAIYTGTHTGSNDATVLTDSTASWTEDELIGLWIYNIDDGDGWESKGQITDNTATTVTATLSGGDENDWDTGDLYAIRAYEEFCDEGGDGMDDVAGIRIGSGEGTVIQNVKAETNGGRGITASRDRAETQRYDDITVQNCTSVNNYAGGVAVKHADGDIVISDCDLSNNRGRGIVVDGCGGAISITDNTISNNRDPAEPPADGDDGDHTTGVKVKGRNDANRLSGTISGNTISDNAYQGINVNQWTDGITVENNIVTGHNYSYDAAGIFLEHWGNPDGSRNHVVRNNTVTGNIRGIIAYYASNSTIEDNTISTDSGTFDTGQGAVKIDHAYNITVTNNNISCDGVGIRVHSTDSYSDTFTGNTIDGAKFAGVYITSGAHDNTFTHNTITGTTSLTFTQYADWGSHDGSDNAAVLQDSTKSWTPGAFVGFTVINLTDGCSGTITANTATTVTAALSGGTENDWDNGDDYDIVYDETQGDGVFLRGGSCYAGGHAGTGNVFNNNSIHSNAGDGMENQTTTTIDASANWWGTNTPTGVAGEISGAVDYTPWLDSGIDTEPGTPGFQGDFSTLWVDDDSPQTGTTGRIQEGINEVSGSTVNVATGVYTENVVIDRDVTINGAGAGVTIVDGDGVGATTNKRVFYINSVLLTVNLNNMTIQHGHAEGSSHGGGIYNRGTLTIADSAIADNHSGIGTSNTGYGGGIYNNGGTLNVSNSTISGNYAGHRGGGIANENGGTLNVTDSTFSDNESQWGGGIVVPSSSATAFITNCTFTGNHANTRGGGINVYRGEVTVTNSTFSANSGVRGAGLSSGDRLTIINSTITTNTTTTSNNGSVYHYAGASGSTLTLINSIVAADQGAANCSGIITDGGHNLEDADDCGFSTSSFTNTNPLLDPLADNGGATWTHALRPSSPAIDAGDDSQCPGTDQRGVPRPIDGDGNGIATCDIGAFEAGKQCELTPTVARATTPYAIQVYTLTLTNNGTTVDTFWFTYVATDTSSLSVPPPENQWGVEMPVSVVVSANLTKTINVTIVIPYDEVDWVTHTVNITATSGSHSTTANATLTTWTGGYWVANRPGPGGAGYVGCRHDINYSGDIDFYQDVQIVIGKYPRTDEPFYDYNHSGDIDFYQDVQRVISKYPDECPSP